MLEVIARYVVACVLLRIILTERDREIAGWCVCADGLGDRQRAMETAQHRDKLPKNQPAEITMFQISEVQESPAFNGRRSFLTLRECARAGAGRTWLPPEITQFPGLADEIKRLRSYNLARRKSCEMRHFEFG